MAGRDASRLTVSTLQWIVVAGVAMSLLALSGSVTFVLPARVFDRVVVTGYEIPWTIIVAPTYTEADYARDARAVLDRTVDEALGPDPDVPVERRLVQRRPAHALTEAAEGAQLLVVGSHGRGEIPGMHLGSVATFCVHHAPCPVLVFRGVHTGR